MLLPAVFDDQTESIAFMARMKQRASKQFRWTSSRCLEDAMYLAYWSFVFYREEDALQVGAFLSDYQFNGNYRLWGWVERALALNSRLLRAQGKTEQAEEYRQRIHKVEYGEGCLSGQILSIYERNIAQVSAQGSASRVREWRAIYATELCLVIELGGSPELPLEQMEAKWQDNLSHLRLSVGATPTN